jgi:hypothetical protein
MNTFVLGDFVRDIRDDTYGIIESFSTKTGFARVQWRRHNGALLRPEDPVFNADLSDFSYTYATQFKIGDWVSDPYESRGKIQRFALLGFDWAVWARWFTPKTRQFGVGYRVLPHIQPHGYTPEQIAAYQ